MYIMTSNGWRRIISNAIAVPDELPSDNGSAYLQRWNAMSWHDKYVELADSCIHSR